MNDKPTYPIVLTIAGSDSSGGAGIQADIKTISALGGYAASVITAVTAQNTQGVSGIHAIPLEIIAMQLDAILCDLDVKAIKIGMLADAEIINLVSDKLQEYACENIVVDPVMVATSGDRLLQESAVIAMQEQLLPLADIITPNLPEAAILAQKVQAVSQVEMFVTAKSLIDQGAKKILLKGGHLEETDSPDLLMSQSGEHWLEAKRIETKNTHGTGCTLSSAIATYLAKGESMETAVSLAKKYIQQAINHADELTIGSGHGPVNHFWKD